MARFVLIHGAAHGAWCWQAVVPALAALGHEALALDLPGHGEDGTPASDVTLDRYADAILAALDGGEIVVGHSMAGFPITHAAARADGRIAALVYLAAYLPRPAVSLSQMRRIWPEAPLVPAIRRSADGLSFGFDPEMAPALFYHDVPSERVADALSRLCPQPVAPMETPAAAAPADLPRHAILCAEDRAIPPDFQREMARDLPPERVSALPASHSPFLSMPEALAARLHRIAGSSSAAAAPAAG